MMQFRPSPEEAGSGSSCSGACVDYSGEQAGCQDRREARGQSDHRIRNCWTVKPRKSRFYDRPVKVTLATDIRYPDQGTQMRYDSSVWMVRDKATRISLSRRCGSIMGQFRRRLCVLAGTLEPWPHRIQFATNPRPPAAGRP